MDSDYRPGPGIELFKFMFAHDDPNAEAFTYFSKTNESYNVSPEHIASMVSSARMCDEWDGLHIQEKGLRGRDAYFLFIKTASDVVSRNKASQIAKGQIFSADWTNIDLDSALVLHTDADCFIRVERDNTKHIVPISLNMADDVFVLGRDDGEQYVPSSEIRRPGFFKKFLSALKYFT